MCMSLRCSVSPAAVESFLRSRLHAHISRHCTPHRLILWGHAWATSNVLSRWAMRFLFSLWLHLLFSEVAFAGCDIWGIKEPTPFDIMGRAPRASRAFILGALGPRCLCKGICCETMPCCIWRICKFRCCCCCCKRKALCCDDMLCTFGIIMCDLCCCILWGICCFMLPSWAKPMPFMVPAALQGTHKRWWFPLCRRVIRGYHR